MARAEVSKIMLAGDDLCQTPTNSQTPCTASQGQNAIKLSSPQVPPTPCTTSSTGVGSMRSLAFPDDEDDDEIMIGKPLWNYAGPSLEELMASVPLSKGCNKD
mmetsp:Transcript_58762/g.137175  ORF Transcript_58762/g.137175 Transcript_58762/m.137175 type:complete len:103 (+) Transcript_58762:119-427(+)